MIKKAWLKYIVNFRYAFRVRKPILVMRLVKTFLGILVLKRRPLRYVDFAIGYRCNLKCRHCFATALEDRSHTRRRLTPEEYGEVVREAMAMGAVNFSFQGGEPLMYESLTDFIKRSYPRRNVISVTTNGTLFDEHKLRDLKKIGVDILSISLDSADPAEHDAFRGGPGSFQRTLQTIQMGKKMGFNITVGAVASHHNIRSKGLKDLIDLAHKLNLIIFLALGSPLGRWQEDQNLVLTEDDKRYLGMLLEQYPLLRTDFEANYIHYGCGAVKEILYLTPYGDVLPCPFLHFSIGNVFQESLRNIRSRGLTSKYFQEYLPRCIAAEDVDFMNNHSRRPFYIQTSEGVRVKSLADIDVE